VLTDTTRLRPRDALRECALGATRQPVRSLLAALGTAIGVAAVIAVTGVGSSASAAVTAEFNAQRPTQVTFVDSQPSETPQVLTEQSESRLANLAGVIHAGLIWNLEDGQPLQVRRTPAPDPTGQESVSLPVLAASPAALAAMGARVSSGRLYDRGFEQRHEMVGLVGSAAATQLNISSTIGDPAVFVGGSAITIIGVVSHVSEQDQSLLGLIVPPYVASVLSAAADTRQIIAVTDPGSAPIIGNQGPYVLSPYDPHRIDAQVPPDPVNLRHQVESSLDSLLVVLAIVAFIVGIAAISNATLLSVIQRRPEIGLRRAIGFRPRHIVTIVVGEAAMIGALGGIIGAALGGTAIGGVAIAHGWKPVLDVRLVLTAPLAGIAAGLIAGAYPAIRASRITPLSALRSP
jgi:putative ABC transport system permease protein